MDVMVGQTRVLYQDLMDFGAKSGLIWLIYGDF